jgi:AraC family transcriptional regulator
MFFLATDRARAFPVGEASREVKSMSQAFAQTTGLAPIDNELVARLLTEALALLDEDRVSARRHIERAAAVARGRQLERPAKGLLADWQVRRAEGFIRTNIASPLRMQDVARTVNLSASYFSRAFKATKGVSYTNFVIRARITLAKQLLLTTDTAISEIALACGLADQSHLTRLFSQSEGLPPRAWRRHQLDEAFDRGAAVT